MKGLSTLTAILFAALYAASGAWAALPSVLPGSRLASWTQSLVNGKPQYCPNASQGNEFIRTAVYYQDDGGNVREAIREGNAAWIQGSMPAFKATHNSPLSVLHWIENGKDNVILLYFVRDGDNQLMEKRFDNSGWWSARSLGVTVQLYPTTLNEPDNLPGGIAAVVTPGGDIAIMYQSEEYIVRLCRFKWSSSAQCAQQAESWGSAVNGTTVSALLDASNHMHFFYQFISPDPVFDIKEVYWNGQAWVEDVISTDGAYGAQVAVLTGRMPPGSPKFTGWERHMLLSYHRRVDWMVYQPSRGCGSGPFCYAGPTGIYYNYPPTLGLAASGCTSNMRGYWVTPWAQIEEVSTDTQGWYVSNADILR